MSSTQSSEQLRPGKGSSSPQTGAVLAEAADAHRPPNTHAAQQPAAPAAAAAPKHLIGFGHPLLDIISHVDRDYLSRYDIELGSCNLAAPEQLPLYEDLSQRRDVEFVPGGASMNAVRVARWMLSLRPDAEESCAYVGCLGDDEFGCILERALNRGGVRSYFQREDDLQTGCCAAVIVEKERSLLANLGAALHVSMEHLKGEEVSAAIAEAGILYFEGFFLNTVSSPDNAFYLGKHCVEHNKLFTWNISAPYLCHIFKERFGTVLPYVDVLFGSRIDATALAEAFEWEETALEDIMRRALMLPKANHRRPRIVVITGGSESTFVATAADGIVEYAVPPVNMVNIVDTNGAGDAFVGGFLSQLMLDQPLEVCVRAGHASAAEVIQHNGCTFSPSPPVVWP